MSRDLLCGSLSASSNTPGEQQTAIVYPSTTSLSCDFRGSPPHVCLKLPPNYGGWDVEILLYEGRFDGRTIRVEGLGHGG